MDHVLLWHLLFCFIPNFHLVSLRPQYGYKNHFVEEVEEVELDHVSQVIGYHPSYLAHFLKIQNFIMEGDGTYSLLAQLFAISSARKSYRTVLISIMQLLLLLFRRTIAIQLSTLFGHYGE